MDGSSILKAEEMFGERTRMSAQALLSISVTGEAPCEHSTSLLQWSCSVAHCKTPCWTNTAPRCDVFNCAGKKSILCSLDK